MAESEIRLMTTVVVEDHVEFTLGSLCQASGAEPEQVRALIDECLLDPTGTSAEEWRFSGDALPRTRRALRLVRDLELDWPGVALVMALLEENERLRSLLRRR